MEEEKKETEEIVIAIPGITSEEQMGEKKKTPRAEFNPLPELEEEKPVEPIIEIDDSGNVKTEEEKKVEVEEEKKPEKPPKEKIKYNKLNKVLMSIFAVVAVVFVIVCLLQFTNPDFSLYMWLGINGTIMDFSYGVMQHLPLVSQFGLIVLFVVFAIVLVIDVFFLIKYKNDIDKKSEVENKIMPIVVVFGLIFLINGYFNFSHFSHRGINEIYMRDNLYQTYTEDDLKNVIDYFKNRIFTYAESLDRKNNQIIVAKNPDEMAIEDLQNLSFKYEFLKGSYPKKIRSLSDFDLVTSGYPLGLTYNYTVGLDETYVNDFSRIFVLTHELCHVKGIIRESDADYCAFLAGFNSNNDVSKYSMLTGLFPNLLYVLKDKNLAKSIENEFGEMCLESGYPEICGLYLKDTYRYIKGTDTLEFNTYSLNVYKDKKEELKQYLLGLKNRFNISITTSENKTISIEEANELIDKESVLSLILKSSINKQTYNENAKYLSTVADYFPHLYLSDSTEKEEDYSSFDYLKPFPKGNYSTITEKEPEYSYDRASRSILEYFNQYVFN